jgi:DNA repair exonuclease SbcCD ATPase subunit
MKLVINKLYVSNFMAWRSFSVIFDKGVHIIQGRNGVGKSAILDAITVALFNKPLRNINLPDLVNRDSSELKIEIDGVLNNKKFILNYKRKLTDTGSSYNVKFNFDGEVVENINEIQNILSNEGLTYEKFKAITLITPQTLPISIADYRYIKPLVETYLNFEEFDEYASYINEHHKYYTEYYNRVKSGISIAQTLVRQYKNNNIKREQKIKELEILLNQTNVSDNWKELIDLEKEQKFLEDQLSNIGNIKAQYDALLAQKQVQSEKKRSFKTLLDAKYAEANKLKIRIPKLKSDLESIKNNVCPLCKQPLHDDTALVTTQKNLKEIETQYSLMQNKLHDLNSEIAKIDIEIQKLNQEINKYKPKVEEFNKYNTRYIQIKSRIKFLNEKIKNGEFNPEKLNYKLLMLKSEQKDDNELKNKFETITIPYLKKRLEYIESVKLLLYHVKQALVSKKERAKLIKNILNYIFDHMNSLLAKFKIEDVYRVKVETDINDITKYKIMLDGDVAKQIGGLSAGQNKLLSVLFALTMSLMYRSKYGDVNLLFLDDIFDTLDYDKIQKLVKFLSELPIDSIYILSHLETLSLPNIDVLNIERGE